jgi:hypothetical protein
LAKVSPAAVLNARRAALQLAGAKGLGESLRLACQDPLPAVRALLVPNLFRFWQNEREAGWKLIDSLGEQSMGSAGVLKIHPMELFGGVSLGILGRHADDAVVRERLGRPWRGLIKKAQNSLLGRINWGWILGMLGRPFTAIMAHQPEFQPINLKEVAKSMARPADFHRASQTVLEYLADPGRGFEGALEVLLEPDRPFDVMLMMIAERTLIYHGCLDPGGVLRGLLRLHRESNGWMMQSLPYIGFHILKRVAEAEEQWLEDYKIIVCESIANSRALFRTELGCYPMIPHLGWAELIFEQHRPVGGARFIPEHIHQALDLGDADYAKTVLRACDILSLAYQQPRLALDVVRQVARRNAPEIRDGLVEVLANVRFYEENAADGFLQALEDKELAWRVRAAVPNLQAADFPTWIDDCMNSYLVHSEAHRRSLAEMFRRATTAGSVGVLFPHILSWGIGLIAGETVGVK